MYKRLWENYIYISWNMIEMWSTNRGDNFTVVQYDFMSRWPLKQIFIYSYMYMAVFLYSIREIGAEAYRP